MKIGERQRRSKIYQRNAHSIAMNNDASHETLTENKVQQAKHVQQKRQIDKILHSVIKQRLFGSFLQGDNQLSQENAYNIDLIHRAKFKDMSKTIQSRTIEYSAFNIGERKPSISHHYTLDVSRSCKDKHEQEYMRMGPRKRNYSQKLPLLKNRRPNQNTQILNSKGPIFHNKKLQVNEKVFGETFKKWVGNVSSNQLIYEIKVTRQNIINKYKYVIDARILDRFFHFFGFPQSFGLRQFSNLIENAANCNLKFIYFWVFSVLDEVNNGALTFQDLFKFIQRLPSENTYIEKQIYEIERYLKQLQRNGKWQNEKEADVLIEEILVMNRNLRLQQLKLLLKQTNKERIDVDCLKNTCYHQTVLSLQHDPLERQKKNQIENTQILSKQYKESALQAKKRLKNQAGIRLRDLYAIYGSRRPKIFCFLLNLLAGVKATDYQ